MLQQCFEKTAALPPQTQTQTPKESTPQDIPSPNYKMKLNFNEKLHMGVFKFTLNTNTDFKGLRNHKNCFLACGYMKPA